MKRPGLARRAFLKQVRGVGLVAAGGLPILRPQISMAAPATLSLWSGNNNLTPFYQMAAEEYAKTHPGFTLDTQSAPMREFEQKLKAAITTDTGPDLFDGGRITTLAFADAGLLPPNPPSVTALLQSKAYDPLVVEYGTWKGRTYGIPFLDGAKPALFYNTRMFAEAGLDPKKPPRTFDELMATARKLVRKDASGNLTRAGISLRLSGQGSGVAEKFWYVLYAMGGDPIVQTNSGRWHNNYDTDAGRAALKFYIDVVHKLSFAKTVPGSLDGGPESSDKLEVRETGMRPGVSAFSGRWPCPVGDEILGTESEPEGRKERGRWAGGGEDRPVLDYAARRTYR